MSTSLVKLPAWTDSIVGKTFNRLTVVSIDKKVGGHILGRCTCSCGGARPLSALRDVVQGLTKSCGCLHREAAKAARTTHGLSQVRGGSEYSVYRGMLNRCTNPNVAAFKNYGGRGIAVCERWLASFPAFLEDMGQRPSKSHTLERKDNDGPYSPDNCVWATWIEQGSNRRSTRLITVAGDAMSVAQWSRKLGINQGTITSRIGYGWTMERIMSEPVRSRRAAPAKKEGLL